MPGNGEKLDNQLLETSNKSKEQKQLKDSLNVVEKNSKKVVEKIEKNPKTKELMKYKEDPDALSKLTKEKKKYPGKTMDGFITTKENKDYQPQNIA